MATINDKIIDEKLQYDINRAAARISALSSGKTSKYEYLVGDERFPSKKNLSKNKQKTGWCYKIRRPF